MSERALECVRSVLAEMDEVLRVGPRGGQSVGRYPPFIPSPSARRVIDVWRQMLREAVGEQVGDEKRREP